MILGFTGTSHGMTQRQKATVSYLFNELPLHILHHGDCIGADEQAHRMAMKLSAHIVVHPPNDPKKRAFCWRSSDSPEVIISLTKPYLARNRTIVENARDGIIAAPRSSQETIRSGTWYTVRYARKIKRRIWIVFPDGTFKEESALQLGKEGIR